MAGETLDAVVAAVVLAAVVAVGAVLGRSRSRRPTRPPRASRPATRRPPSRPSSRPSDGTPGTSGAPARLPQPREIWWAQVPFEDGTGSKDRPCLVLHRGARTATVLKITSKHHAELPGVIPLPPGTVGDREHRASWLETDEAREVPFADFRRRVGAVDPQLWTRVRKARP
ncbi:type II toxin-antitoxin system PemK/MazF family toxin [Streptacidiphilus sp. PB12-B1b]|uniref:type II toxin-antitoxin system PemK/MazF family toxin n=1 Tax=Streptacidiphilus sp. PB12-B1b TaxID=2705012 RepID=UPI0015F90022|nr:type II toxin-antitoxin system PemK/MazF family toxin [Streptacidiphilus sp. PB12-B1b]QMU75617.1 type II toxin-antitoxin system PemK/MazF family toxin [Streptacidiphilus sp. PB12-B1b]